MLSFLKAIIRPSYWYTHQAIVPEFWVIFLSILFGCLVVMAIVLGVLSTRKKFHTPIRTLFGRISVWGWFFGLSGYILLFFSVQRVAFLSARGWYLLWVLGAIAWVVPIIRYGVKDVPERIRFKKEQQEKDKWLPTSKK